MSQTKENENKWLKRWEQAHIFEADPDPKRRKIMVTFPYPYMNGPLHVGHTFTATRVDAYATVQADARLQCSVALGLALDWAAAVGSKPTSCKG